jgi:hypothetical protein
MTADLIAAWEAETGGRADSAVPQQWADAVAARTGEYPVGWAWGYLPGQVFGAPVPLTADARALAVRLAGTGLEVGEVRP